MTTQIGASVLVDPSQIRHDITNGNPTITFGPWPTVNRVDVHLGDRATIHAVIAHLVALEQEMAPPVIADDEPAPKCETCGATDDLEKTLWLSMADHSERARYFCNDRRACNDRRFPEMAALLASGPEEHDDAEWNGFPPAKKILCDRPEHHAAAPSAAQGTEDGVLLPAGGDPDKAVRAGDPCACGHPLYQHGDSVTGARGYCTLCIPGDCPAFRLAETEPASVAS